MVEIKVWSVEETIREARRLAGFVHSLGLGENRARVEARYDPSTDAATMRMWQLIPDEGDES